MDFIIEHILMKKILIINRWILVTEESEDLIDRRVNLEV